MAYFARIGDHLLNVEAICFARRTSDGLEVIFGRQGAAEASVIFTGAEADRVETLILKYQEIVEASLRRQRVIEAQF